MVQHSSASRSARAWLSPFLLLPFVILLGGCATQNRSVLVAPPGSTPPDEFPRIVSQADRTSTARAGGFELKVHHAVENEFLVPEAIEALRRPVEFLRESTGLQSSGKIEAYLHSLGPDQDPPHFEPRGRADFTTVFFVSEGQPLLGRTASRNWYLEVLPHELAHTFLRPLPLKDRWLEDGLAEYLKRAFVRRMQAELPSDRGDQATLRDWNPVVEALRRVEWSPWTHRTTNKVLKLRHDDPALAAYLGQQEVWNYAAAAELLERWMAAAAEAGIERPVLDLVQRIRNHGGSVRWDDTRELVRAQTGRSVEDLVRVTEEDIAGARQSAWSEQRSPVFASRVRALRTLTFIGLPEGADPMALIPSFDPPEDGPGDSYVTRALAVAASGAVAASKDPKAAATAAEILRARHGDEAYRFTHPSLWSVLAKVERDWALTALVSTLNDSRVGLGDRKLANEHLEALTGSTVGWSIDLSPSARKQTAAMWSEVIS